MYTVITMPIKFLTSCQMLEDKLPKVCPECDKDEVQQDKLNRHRPSTRKGSSCTCIKSGDDLNIHHAKRNVHSGRSFTAEGV